MTSLSAKIPRIFVDSSVLFSGSYSSKGHSRDLILLAIRGAIILVVSQVVLAETRRNLAECKVELVALLDVIEANTPFEVIQVTRTEVLSAANYVVLKDAPIAAAAKKGKVDLLVTLDRKHLLENPDIASYIGIRIVTPKEAFELIKNRI